ncbi:subclass B3 metallo-beta-lactamase [Sphingomonas naphthae]|uniref:Subclass B3 metallo-beta-lactamase n=1 Tax=Sphingomonas naphthae TaxID=1813468 RepID=A0ABY7TPK9_9SPHN|nr:subclass B3 metallo-beta-lactamase [Sphingomonas naphthae]WCT74636.1 subclass B3 metallo-beta-lactamase [Sphingomonas naphthae]
MRRAMRWMAVAATMASSLALAQSPPPPAPEPAPDPLTAPLGGDNAARWLEPQPPTRIHGNTYLVGYSGLNVGLIDTGGGLILIDAGLPQGIAGVEAHIRQLGFRVEDVKYLLSTEPHYDHAGGLAALARDTGATVVASGPAARVLEQGRSGTDDPQEAWLPAFPAVKKVRVVRPGERLKLGKVTVTAQATPGHTPGSMSWSWSSCEEGKCLGVTFAASLNPLAAEGYRYDTPAKASPAAAFRHTFAAVRALPCDILLTSHPEASDGQTKFARLRQGVKPNPFIDPAACRAYADKYEPLFDKRIADEKSGAAK